MFLGSPCAKERASFLPVYDKEMIPMYSLVGLVLFGSPGPKDEVITSFESGRDVHSNLSLRSQLIGSGRT